MQQLRDTVRSKVDEMRASAYLQEHNREDVLAELANVAVAATDADASDGPGAGPVHKCPWHTCAATRHG
ncbi:hypothetical protein [Pseudomonas putida]